MPQSGVTKFETNQSTLIIAEAEATKAKPNSNTFVGSCISARTKAAENAEVLFECCERLQAHNRRIKEYVAIYDTETVHEALEGGFLGMGCNDRKLIAAVCTRTKSQLQRTAKRYREAYDKDIREEVMDETGGGYRKLMYFLMSSSEGYIADIIELACNEAAILEFGCDEICLLEVRCPACGACVACPCCKSGTRTHAL